MMPMSNMIWQIAEVQDRSTREMEHAMGRLAAAVSRRYRRARRRR
ncbi:hypothetical protein [Actinoplanes aureus]|jgi:hypothetical protein|nr:hypothetical protein [Actinoplanes aureus]